MICCLIPNFPTDRKTKRRRSNLRLHCFPPVSDFGAMRVRFRRTVSGRYSYFPQFSIESKRVPQAIIPCKTPCFLATTWLNGANSSYAVVNNSRGSIFSQKQIQDDLCFTRVTCPTQTRFFGDPALYLCYR